MITKTLNLDSAYSELFDEIREKSNGAIDINNVEGFFGNIIEISALDKKYLRLPLDEPMFEIDANTRKIEVPNEFKSNGLSVQGDHLAETVYFVIDRYFDYMDLNNTDVSINWKMGAESGKTDRFTMSADVIPGSIVFGWPVNNIVTQKSGALTFAVEFCRKDGQGNVLYDFNTLAASINIKEGLIVSDVEVVNLDNDILAALANSQFGEGDAAVGPIVWLTGEGHGLVVGFGPEGSAQLQPYAAEINLNTGVTEGVPYSIAANLYAQGFVDNGTEVKYMDSVGNNLTPVMATVSKPLVKVEDMSNLDPDKIYLDSNGPGGSRVDPEDLEDAEELWTKAPLDEGLIYYVKLDENAYEVASEEQIAAWNTDDEVALYIKLAKIQATEAGTYIIKAQGQKFDNEGRKIGAGMTESTDVVIVPPVQAPSAIAIEKSAPPTIEEEAENYSFDEETSENVVFITDEAAGTLTANAVLDTVGALQYVWQKKVGNENNFSNIAEGDVDYIAYDRFHTVLNSELPITEEGEYKVLVKHFLNGGYSSQVASEVFKASKLAGKITSAQILAKKGNSGEFAAPENNAVEYSSADGQLQGKVTLRISDVVIDGQQGELSYEWYKQSTVDDQVVLTLVNSGNDYVISSGEGRFIPVVKNEYNGSIYTYQLSSIFVDDSSNN